ncbi:uncharacterized protein [Antedon mediterranea]|uniref:uncharacterized protein n=1 Tax=Antedon mediterranea TaxID=105859 RepID=UPI003AF6020B
MVTDKLREKKTIDMKPPTDDVEDDDGIVVDYNNDDNNDDYKNNDNNDYKNDSSYTATKAVTFDTDQQLDKDVIKKLEEKKEDPLEETFNIWDHGGQLIYHGIHRMFMTLQALYIVVFDLSVDLNDPAVYIDSNGQKCKHHWTNLQFILSYILSVYSHSRIVKEDEENEVNKPTILIVGTHKGKLGKTEKEQNDEANIIFEKVQDVLRGKLYEEHIYKYFAIENSRETTDKSFSDLKEVIEKFMATLEKDVPLKWMRFRCDLQDLRREKHFSLCPLEELKMLATKNGIEKEQSVLLNFLYDLGEIVYMPDNKLLRDKAVLDPMQLVEIVTAFVTVIPPKFPKPAFRRLDKGILEEKLLRKLWKERKVDEGKNFEFLVALMIQLGFICEKTTTNNQDLASTSTECVGKRSFFVPLRLAFKTSTEGKPMPDEFPAISIYYDFKGYLPDVLFPYMIIDFLNKFQKKGDDPILLYNHAELYFDQDHHVTLSLVKFVTTDEEDERKFLLKVTIKRTNVPNEASNEEPSSEACKEVLLTIQKSFAPTKDGGRRGIQFERCILCDICSDTSEKKHIQNLGDFQDEKLPCSKTGTYMSMDVTRYKRLFGDESWPKERRGRKTDQGNTMADSETLDSFRDLKGGLSGYFDGERYHWLRFLLFDQLDVGDLTNPHCNGHDLLNTLEDKGFISPTNVNLLLEITNTSEIQQAKDLVSKYMRDNNIQDRHTDRTKLSSYRKRLFKALKQVDPDALRNVTAYYDLTKYNVSNVWDAVLYLENDKQLVDDFDKIQRFAERLGGIASNTLLDVQDGSVTSALPQSDIQGSQQELTKLLASDSPVTVNEELKTQMKKVMIKEQERKLEAESEVTKQFPLDSSDTLSDEFQTQVEEEEIKPEPESDPEQPQNQGSRPSRKKCLLKFLKDYRWKVFAFWLILLAAFVILIIIYDGLAARIGIGIGLLVTVVCKTDSQSHVIHRTL